MYASPYSTPSGFLEPTSRLVKYVPEWMPGASFKRKAREWRGVAERFYTIPFDFVKQSMADGTVKPSFTSLALRDITENDDRKYPDLLPRDVDEPGRTRAGPRRG